MLSERRNSVKYRPKHEVSIIKVTDKKHSADIDKKYDNKATARYIHFHKGGNRMKNLSHALAIEKAFNGKLLAINPDANKQIQGNNARRLILGNKLKRVDGIATSF